MKFNKIFSVVVFSLIAMLSLAEDIKIRSFYKDGNVLLRWYPSTYDVFLECVEEGFVVERRELDKADGWQRVGDVKKASLNEILQFADIEKNVEILAFVMYGDKYIDYLVEQDSSFSRHELKQKFAEMMDQDGVAFLYGMTLLQSEFSASFAKFAALNFMDEEVATQTRYEYRVRPANSSLGYQSGTAPTSTYKNDVLAPMSEMKIDHSNRRICLKWNISDEMRRDYSGYNIERSEDGKTFQVVNEQPIVHLITENQKDKSECSYCDTLPDCGKNYFYRVCGISGFGLTGPYSNVEAVRCTDQFTAKSSIVKMVATKKNEVQIHWEVKNDENQDIKGFVVQRAIPSSEKLDFADVSKMMGPKKMMFVDKNPLKRCFYRVKTYGYDGQFTEGNIDYINVSDTLPPVAPTGLVGDIDKSGVVRLTWNANTDEVRGYKVFFANNPNQRFAPACDTTIFVTNFNDTLCLGTLTNDIYYKVAAVGENFAMSQLSDAIKIVKPDTISPADAVMDEMTQLPSGEVRLKWFDSPSRDLSKTRLLRRKSGDTDWIVLAEWVGATTPENFTDTSFFKGELVYYCLTVSDESGNESRSIEYGIKTKYVKPHCAKDFVAEKADGGITLQWSRCGCDTYGTRVYRIEDGKQRLVATLTAKETGYFDRMTKPGHTYQYFILPMTEKMSHMEKSVVMEF